MLADVFILRLVLSDFFLDLLLGGQIFLTDGAGRILGGLGGGGCGGGSGCLHAAAGAGAGVRRGWVS